VTAESPDRSAAAAPDLVFSCRGVSVELSHTDGPRRVLDDISLDLSRGEFLTIVGPSGTGKTTLIRLLAGLTRSTRGTVDVNNRPIDGPPEDVIIVFQDYSHALLQWRTVARNVALGLEGRLPRGEIKARVDEALRLVRLSAHAGDHPWQLSGGMQQRVQIARALAVRPAVLLMDEPFAALDAMTKAALQDELLRLRDETRSSVVFVTHDIEEAVYLGDRVAVITGAPGRIERIVEVDLPKPRDQIVTRQLPRFLELRYLLHHAIGQTEHA